MWSYQDYLRYIAKMENERIDIIDNYLNFHWFLFANRKKLEQSNKIVMSRVDIATSQVISGFKEIKKDLEEIVERPEAT